MGNIKHYDIAIIGKGITGLSSAYALRSAGYQICFSNDKTETSTTQVSAKMISGGFIDNFTRISQRHGLANAISAWRFANLAFDATLDFAREHDVPFKIGTRVRLIETEDERVESLKAVEQLNQADFNSHFQASVPQGSVNLSGQQIDAPRAATIEKSRMLKVLEDKTGNIPTIDRTRSIHRERDHFVIQSESETIYAEVVILACHLGLRDLVPSLKDVFVPSQDQWHRFQTAEGVTLPFPVGSLITWKHGHYWASIESKNQLCVGGARFLRPMAGFEAEASELNEKVRQHLPLAWIKYFPTVPLIKPLDQRPGLDIRPCDEMPIIGPLFGDSGIFIGAGYMGQGLSLGFRAGQSLANLVLGKSDDLPRFFWPERHRSLSETK